MKKIITRDYLDNGNVSLYTICHCTIDGIEYQENVKISGSHIRDLEVSRDTKFRLLQNHIISVVPTMAKRIEVVTTFPGMMKGDIIYLPYTEELDISGKSKIIFNDTYIEYNGVRLSIDILDTYPDYFKITLVENPEVNEIEYI